MEAAAGDGRVQDDEKKAITFTGRMLKTTLTRESIACFSSFHETSTRFITEEQEEDDSTSISLLSLVALSWYDYSSLLAEFCNVSYSIHSGLTPESEGDSDLREKHEI